MSILDPATQLPAAYTGKLTGLSLSLCIRDIIQGKVPRERLSNIISGTAAYSDGRWAMLLTQYSTSYWKDDPVVAHKLVMELREANLIYQPRLDDKEPPNSFGGQLRWIPEYLDTTRATFGDLIMDPSILERLRACQD